MPPSTCGCRPALAEALESLDPAVRAGLEESIRRLRATCEAELEPEVVSELGPGARVTHRFVPIRRVGLYVPGGLAPLVSSVVMNVVPAQVAGVGSIALASSPQQDNGGLPAPTILAACALLGVDEVYAVGGAQAIAMFAYGAGECEPVDLVTGPGNIYTVAAKRLLKGVVGIDSEAGPTEIAILADDSADAAYVAADLISQAEHDPMAASVLVTDLRAAGRRRRGRARQAGVRDQAQRADPHGARRPAVGHRAGRRPRRRGWRWSTPTPRSTWRSRPQDAADVAARVRNAGAIFVGPYAPVSLGDYCAGSNHVLPDRRLRLPLLRAVGAVVPQGGPRRRLRPRRAGARWPATWSRSPRPRTCPGHGEAVAIRFQPMTPGSRCGRSCAAWSPTARRSSTSPSGSTSTRTPTRRPRRVVADIERAVAEAARELNRYPDREAVALREALAGLPRARPHAGDRCGRRNGSNEVMLHLLQAFGGPGRPALSFAPTYSMYPEYARDTHTALGGRAPRGGLHPRRQTARSRWSGRGDRTSYCCRSPNNPTGTALAPEVVTALCEELDEGVLVVDEAYAEFRRAGTPERAGAAAEPPEPRGHPHHEQGVRAGRRPGRLPRGDARDLRRAPRRPAALPPVGGHPGSRAGRAAARRRAARCGRRPAGRTRRDGRVAAGPGFTVADSDANFVLFGRFADRHAVWQGLLDRGVLVRETGPDGWLRVSIGTAAEMAAFRDALTSVTETTEATP